MRIFYICEKRTARRLIWHNRTACPHLLLSVFIYNSRKRMLPYWRKKRISVTDINDKDGWLCIDTTIHSLDVIIRWYVVASANGFTECSSPNCIPTTSSFAIIFSVSKLYVIATSSQSEMRLPLLQGRHWKSGRKIIYLI